MNGYALASVALVCLTACVLFALWRHYQRRDTQQQLELLEQIAGAKADLESLADVTKAYVSSRMSALVEHEATVAKLVSDVKRIDDAQKMRVLGGRS